MIKTQRSNGRSYIIFTKTARVDLADVLSVRRTPDAGAHGSLVVTSKGAMRVLEDYDEIMEAIFGMDAAAPTNAEGEQ